MDRQRVLVRGVGDVGSAVAHRLFTLEYEVVIHDEPLPATSRRGMAFTDAMFHGRAELENVVAIRAHDLEEVAALLTARQVIPVVTAELNGLLTAVQPDVLVDARMRKRSQPEGQRNMAPLTIGLGPNFVAGKTVDLAIETSWNALGQIVAEGPTLALAGEPRGILGRARDRFIYAPAAGVFRTTCQIGDLVQVGDTVAQLDDIPLPAPLDGLLRGLTHDGVPVTAGFKVVEVDPRGEASVYSGMGERPKRIAEGVIQAIRRREAV